MNKDELLELLRKKGFSEEIISAFAKVKREEFVPQNLVGYAYEDMALPVMDGSTLSQPSTAAFMLNLLEPKEGQKILEIGSGSGYVLSLLSEIVKESGKVYGVEIIKDLAIASKKRLESKKNIEIIIRSGFNGLPEFSPYDRILVSASAENVPYHLLSQLKENGILVSAVKNSIIRIKKEQGKTYEEEFPGFAFVPLRQE
ncbi:MAG: protein-L-isoaspartate O-methyltransferase [Candidatus Pacearchaeota archaeon]